MTEPPGTDALIMWTVYDHPLDYPALFVARKFAVRSSGAEATSEVVLAERLDTLRREMIERGLTCITRDQRDDPKIIEVWL